MNRGISHNDRTSEEIKSVRLSVFLSQFRPLIAGSAFPAHWTGNRKIRRDKRLGPSSTCPLSLLFIFPSFMNFLGSTFSSLNSISLSSPVMRYITQTRNVCGEVDVTYPRCIACGPLCQCLSSRHEHRTTDVLEEKHSSAEKLREVTFVRTVTGHDPESYAGGSVATGRATHAG
jgi:hypothetical protein